MKPVSLINTATLWNGRRKVGVEIAVPTGFDAAEYDARWLGADGRIRLLPAAEFRAAPSDHLRLWLHLRARYALPTAELVEWLKERIGGRRAIEVGAGNGDLGRHIGIVMTDSRLQQTPAMRAFYTRLGQVPTCPPPDVLTLDAETAVARLRPKVVVASWLTRRFVPGVDVGGVSDASVYSPCEERFLAVAETYVHIGARHVHGTKTLLGRPHQEYRVAGLISRCQDPADDVIYVWERGDA